MNTDVQTQDAPPVPEVSPKVPKFHSCLVDAQAPLCIVKFNDAEFRLRSITAGESADIDAETRLKEPYDDEFELEDGTKRKFRARHDGRKKMLKTVAAALGAREVIGREGWSYDDPVTEDAVLHLADGIVELLYERHSSSFRPDRFGAAES